MISSGIWWSHNWTLYEWFTNNNNNNIHLIFFESFLFLNQYLQTCRTQNRITRSVKNDLNFNCIRVNFEKLKQNQLQHLKIGISLFEFGSKFCCLDDHRKSYLCVVMGCHLLSTQTSTDLNISHTEFLIINIYK